TCHSSITLSPSRLLSSPQHCISFRFSLCHPLSFFFFFNDPATTEIYTFPYTTLFRSLLSRQGGKGRPAICPLLIGDPTTMLEIRSEEHTSELQSLTNLVCRLLLEKKKN